MKTVILESPFKGQDFAESGQHLLYVNAVARKMLLTGECTPLYFHSLYTQCLDDDNKDERRIGIDASLKFHDLVKTHVVAIDRGISEGMIYGIEAALKRGSEIIFYTLCENGSPEADVISKINQIEDLSERCNIAIKTINSLKKDLSGDVTSFRSVSQSLLLKTEKSMQGIADRIDCI